jgi:nucleotide-binding universal stress UspA family protein
MTPSTPVPETVTLHLPFRVVKRGEAADFAKGHLGSNLERIVRVAHRPVLVAARAFRSFSSVLAAPDGGRCSAMKAADHMARSPLLAGLAVTVVTVGADTEEARKGLADAAALLKATCIEAATRILPGQPEAGLGRLVEAEGLGLVVTGAYGPSRIRSLMLGSTTTEMIRPCRVPILLMR